VFIGRQTELTALRYSVDVVAKGTGRIVIIEGNSGVGKTRLTRELASIAADQRLCVLVGQCEESSSPRTYRPWHEIIMSLAEASNSLTLKDDLGAGAQDIVSNIAPDLAEKVTELSASRVADTSPDPRQTLFAGVRSFIKNLARRNPLVLIIEDIHHADAASVALLEYLASDIRTLPILVAVTRNIESQASNELLAALAGLQRVDGATPMVLRPFSQLEIQQFIKDRTGAEPSEPILQRIADLTDGNAQFLTDLMDHLLTVWQLRATDVTFAQFLAGYERFPLPSNWPDLVRLRIGALATDGIRILNLAATVGWEFDRYTLQRIRPPLGRDAVARTLRLLEERRIVHASDTPGHYRFVHVYRETIYEGMMGIDRATCHRQIADALEKHYGPASKGPHLTELAHHFYNAADGGDSGSLMKAITYSSAAARWDGDMHLAYEDAARHCDRALEVLAKTDPADKELRCDLLLYKASMQNNGGNPHALQTYREAGALAAAEGYVRQQADAAFGCGRRWGRTGGGTFGSYDQDLVVVLEAALYALSDAEWQRRVELLACLAAAYYSGGSRHQAQGAECAERAVSIASEHLSDDPAACRMMAYALDARHIACWTPDNLEQRREVAKEMLAQAKRAGDRQLEMDTHLWFVVNGLEDGNLEEVSTNIQAYESLATSLNLFTHQWWETGQFTALALLQGRYSEAESSIKRAGNNLGKTNDPNAMMNIVVARFLLSLEKHELGGLEESLNNFIDRYPLIPGWRIGRALLYCELGHRNQAVQDFEVFVRKNFELPFDSTWLAAMTVLCEVCVLLGDDLPNSKRVAAVLYKRLQNYGDRGSVAGFSAGWFGAVARALGLLATMLKDFGAAERWFTQANVLHHKMNADPWIARTHYDLAVMYMTRDRTGDPAKVSQHRQIALDLANRLGMARLKWQIAALDRHFSPVAMFSGQESRVLKLMCEHLTNKQIAERMKIKPGTVNKYVDRIFGKIKAYEDELSRGDEQNAGEPKVVHYSRAKAVDWARKYGICKRPE
jgi:DNA-binding CsgD family transcriptional regulator